MRLTRLAPLLLLIASAAQAQFTETAVTVAPGRFLVEMDALSIGVDRDEGTKATAVAVATTFLTTGLTANLDVQVGAELFLSQKFDAGGLSERDSGFGDLYLRSKWRFLDGGNLGPSAAIIPFVKLPTSTGGVGTEAVEGGLIMPWDFALGGGAFANVMGAVDLVRNDADDGYDSNWLVSASATVPFTTALHFYGEAHLAKSTSGADAEGSLGAGVAIYLTEHTWWDFGVYRGLTSATTDWTGVARFNFGF